MASALVAVGGATAFGQAGIVGGSMWTKQQVDPKFRMLDGSKVYRNELDALRSISDDILNNSGYRFLGWRRTFFHQGPLLFIALLMAENFGLFDRNFVSTGLNASHNFK